ncbi:MAG: beta-ketoacyl-ACP synthase II [Alphaproteobacteria bacterium]|nr:beta-ketoacyl-ACP synthase II [Alphaproteobacteria bacterium]MBN2675127.1 beta-ketoacyl-ACP synthase II [Alphaproteobacteria bacterium]
MRRVVITGMGIVSPVGTGVEYAWKNVVAGKSGVSKIEIFDASDLGSQIAGVPVYGTEPGQYNPDIAVEPAAQRKMDKAILYGVVAATEAVKDAGLDEYTGDKERVGVSIGGGIGGLDTIYETCVELHAGGPRRVSPFFIPKAIINMASGHVSIKYGFKGPNISIVTACATGSHSIGEGVRLIQHGDADIMICGGSEGAVCKLGMAGFCSMKALSNRNDDPASASRPWDKSRDGFVMAEGAAILVVEEYEHAKARGAKIYAEVAGYGMSGDAYHITAPAEGGAGGRRAMQNALNDAGLKPTDVDYVNAHGTSTGLGDIGELTAVKTLFADNKNIAMSSTKSVTGHMLGAAGAAEAIFSALAIRDGIMPATMNLQDPEDLVGDFDLVPNKARKKELNVVVSNSFGFGGTNASLVLKKI